MCILKVYCLLFYVLICGLSCGGAGASRHRMDAASEVTIRATPAQNVPPDTVITLERDECGGYCPVYMVTISANGGVVYKGKKFVKMVGIAKGHVSVDTLRRLISDFEAVGYFSLKDGYSPARGNCPRVATDLSSATTSIRIGGKSKSVEHYHGCSGLDVLKDLAALEDKIDEAVNARQWVK